MKRRKQHGFSLIELLVVVAIILIIAAIAIPNLLKAKGAANSASAVSSLRAVTSANQLYQNTNNAFAPNLGTLGPATANLLDTVLSGCTTAGTACTTDVSVKAGYNFTYIAAPFTAPAVGPTQYLIIGVPTTGAPAALPAYCSDSSGAIMQDTSIAPVAPGTAATGFGAGTVTTGCAGDTAATGL